MNLLQWAVAQLRATRRGWGAVALAAGLWAMLLTVAMGVGNGLRDGLRGRAAARSGPVVEAWVRREGFFGADAAMRLAPPGTSVGAALRVEGATSGAMPVRVALWGLGVTPWTPTAPAPGEGWLAPSLAASLGVSEGDRLIVRVARPGVLPRDAALAQEEGRVVALALDVRVVDEAWPAHAALDADPLAAPGIRVDRAWLGARLGRDDAANLLLFDRPVDQPAFHLADLSLSLVPSHEGDVLVSDGVLLPDALVEGLVGWRDAEPMTTWFYEGVRTTERSVPYGFVTTEPALGPDDIVIVEEVARRLGVGGGDVVTLRFPVIGRGRAVAWEERPFRVVQVVDDDTWSAARTPPIEGLTGRSRCGDWNPGLDVDLSKIGDEDEAWWSARGATPRLAIGDGVAPQMVANPWGRWTGVRFAGGVDEPALLARLQESVGWASLGWVRRDVAGAAALTARPSTDFGALFLGFQSILFGAAFALAASTAGLVAAMRVGELATLRALGFSVRRARGVFLAEVAVVALGGAAAGVATGWAVAPHIGSWLHDALGGVLGSVSNTPRVDPASASVALVVAALATLAAAAWGSAPAFRVTPLAALRRVEGIAPARWSWAAWAALAAGVGAVLLVGLAPPGRTPATVGAFFGAGALMMAAAAFGLLAALQRPWPGLLGLLTAGAASAPSRPLAVLLTLGGSVWLVAGVGLGAGQAAPDVHDPSGPTGGFASVVSWVLPPLRPVQGAVPVWVHYADDASCLQLGTATTPHVFAVDPSLMQGRFRLLSGVGLDALGPPEADGAVPVVGDVATLTWGLKAGLGDRLTVADGSGRPLTLKVVGVLDKTAFQGGLWMDLGTFRARFPSEEGPRLGLIERDPAALLATSRDLGATVETTAERLARYDAVEHAYVGVFRTLGGLGVVLGALAVPLLWMRSLVEREQEIRMLRSLGFPARRVLSLLLLEHVALFGLALAVGGVAAIVSAWPALAPGAPWGVVVGSWLAAALLGLGVFRGLYARVVDASGV